MSAFDDEFGLFGDDDAAPDEERKPTLGARKIATNESNLDDIEPEDERPARARRSAAGGEQRDFSGARRPPFRDHGPRPAGDPAIAQARAVELLRFLAKKLVSQPDEVIVEVVEGQRGPVIELEVHPEDFGKVIGKGGRVAQALRTIVRASAEGKVTIDIVDVEDDDEEESDADVAAKSANAAVDTAGGDGVGETDLPGVEDEGEESEAEAEAKPVKKKPAARKKASATAAPKRKKKA